MDALTPIECRGSLYAVGRRYGEARKEELARSVENFFTLFAAFPIPADRPGVTHAASRLLDAARGFDPEGVEFVRGQADGAGLAFEEAFCLHCFLEVMFNYGNLSAMCTSFAVGGPATRGGVTIAGQNVDWFASTTVDLLRINHDNGLKSLSLCMFGVPYYHLTSAGLCNCANLTFGPQQAGPQVPLGVYLFKAMREPDLDGAMSVIRSAARGLGYYHLADARNMLGIESVQERQILVRPEEGVLAHANNYESQEFRALDLGLAYMPDSPVRAARMRGRIMAGHGRITAEYMMDVLQDHKDGPNSICRHPDPNLPPVMATVSCASYIALPGEGTLWVSNGPPCENGYTRYQV